MEVKSWEAQRLLWAAQQSRPFCINVEGLEGIGAFSELDMKSDIVRRATFFFVIKSYCLPVGERLVGLSNVTLSMAER